MIEERTRSSTDAELRSLQRHIAYYESRKRSWGWAISLAIVGFLVALFLVSFSARLSAYGGSIALAAGLLVGTAVYLFAPRPAFDPAHLARLRSDLRAAQTVETTFPVRDVIQVDEFEDEGITFFLLTDNDKVLLMSGQDFYEPVERGEAPAERVTLCKTPTSGYVFSEVFSGKALLPSKRPLLTDREIREYFADGTPAVLEVAFDSLRRPRE